VPNSRSLRRQGEVKMKRRKLVRLFSCSLALVIAAGSLQSCTLIDTIVSGFTRYCEGPFLVSKYEDTNDGLCGSGDCSLREAVIASNDCPGRQTIRFGAGDYLLTIEGAGEDAAATGDLDITDDVFIIGDVARDAVVDGNGIDRVFEVDSGVSASFEGVHMRNGFGDSDGGGALLIQWYAEVNLNGVEISDSTAGSSSSYGVGGGLRTDGQVTAEDLLVEDNTAYGQGGGIWVGSGGSLRTAEAVVRNNRSLNGYGGGGLWSRGNVDFNGTVSGNMSDWTGGGIVNLNTMVIRNSTVEDNTASSAGGGISNLSQLDLENVTVRGNEAPSGGGLFSYASPRYGLRSRLKRSRLNNSTFEENTARRGGGGIFNSEGVLLIATGTDLYRNGANQGGGIYNVGEATLLEATIGGNTAGSGQGGGVFNRGLINLTRSTLAANRGLASTSSFEAPAIYTEEGGHVELTNSTVSGHSMTARVGGVIANVSGSLRATHATVSDNEGPIFGGLISSINASELENSIVAGNSSGGSCSTGLTSLGGNMFDMTGCGDVGTDLVIVPGSDGLGPLANNGGSTMTHALDSSSPAVDLALDSGCQATDQRGISRPAGAHCDAGAYELEDLVAMSGELPEGIPISPATCRSGPRSIYPVLGYLNEGETVQLLSRNEETSWLQVKSKDGRLDPCWVDVDLLDIPPRVDLPALELGYIPPEPTLTPEPEDDLRKGCRVYDQFQNLVCAIPCPSENNQGVCYRE
jgi:CSLREA domain-containing protein